MTVAASGQGFRGLPTTVVVPPHRMRLIRLIVAAVVVGPVAGSGLAVVLALRNGGVSPAALAAFAVGYCASLLGITVGFHRHFAHRAFKTSRALQLTFIVLGSTALQGSLLYWVATHRRHHQFSDTEDDPHSPHFGGAGLRGAWRGFMHSHVGWMFSSGIANTMRFTPDLLRDRFVFEVQRRYGLWAWLGLLTPAAVAAAVSHSAATTLEIFLWAGPVRLLAVHHASWAVGSFSHMYGARPFKMEDRSANNLWVAIVAFGEGLQNNHHAFPRSARHGFRWWEPDVSGLVIDALSRCGLVWDVFRPAAEHLAARRLESDSMGEATG